MEAAHEISGPLNAAMTAVELLTDTLPALDEGGDEGGRELLDTARRQLHLAMLQVTRFARLESHAAPPERRRVDLTALAVELVDDLRFSLLDRHTTDVEAPGAVDLEVDPDMIRQVLFNLLSNAVRYSPPDRRIVIAITPAGDAVEVRVRDQGCGVAPDDAERIFERYERGDVETSGMGLGLALSRDIAEVHGGELQLEPADGEGSTFLLTLPLVAADG